MYVCSGSDCESLRAAAPAVVSISLIVFCSTFTSSFSPQPSYLPFCNIQPSTSFSSWFPLSNSGAILLKYTSIEKGNIIVVNDENTEKKVYFFALVKSLWKKTMRPKMEIMSWTNNNVESGSIGVTSGGFIWWVVVGALQILHWQFAWKM